MKLSLIGYGKMAKALLAGLYEKYAIEVIGRNEEKLQALQKEYPNIEITLLKAGFDIKGKNILLCVKPYVLKELVALQPKGEARAIYSILAGVSLETLHAIKAKNYYRAMPNVAAEIGASATTLMGDVALKEEALEIFGAIGSTVVVESEKELDIATALAGSGPAFLALVAESLVDGAVKEGLKRDVATELAKGLFLGSAKLLQNTHPKDIKESVMSPGGTTAAGIYALEDSGARSAFMKAIKNAFEKSQELKKS